MAVNRGPRPLKPAEGPIIIISAIKKSPDRRVAQGSSFPTCTRVNRKPTVSFPYPGYAKTTNLIPAATVSRVEIFSRPNLHKLLVDEYLPATDPPNTARQVSIDFPLS